MRNELEYFNISGEYGGNQDWFIDPWMHLGGCGAETACDCSIYFTMYKGKDLYPFDISRLDKRDYIRFSRVMKPYLRPRHRGIDRLDIYINGFEKYLRDRGENGIGMDEFSGHASAEEARAKVIAQIDKGLPIPILVLQHKNPRFADYVWHWFLLNGYEWRETAAGAEFFVKAVTYGEWEWLDFKCLWDTGHSEKGGLVLFYEKG